MKVRIGSLGIVLARAAPPASGWLLLLGRGEWVRIYSLTRQSGVQREW